MKPKTNWNGLTEEAKETFFTFFMWCEFGYRCGDRCEPRYLCPNEFRCDEMLCYVLFPSMNRYCPCHVYKDDAFPALKQCLIKDGWIEE